MAVALALSESSNRPSSPLFAKVLTALVFLILYVPLFSLIVYSFFDPMSGEWTWRFYPEAFQDQGLLASIRMSLTVGLWSTLGATLLGTTAALALERTDFPGKRLMDALTLVPLVVPEIVFGLSLLIWFVTLHLTLGALSIILAHITFSFSYVIITVRTRLHGFDHSLEEAARDLGATPWKTFWRVTFPLIFPGILSGALMAFTLSFDDFLITFFTSGVASDTLPIKLYSMIKYGISPKINALSSAIFLVTVVMVMLTFRPQVRRKAAPKEDDSDSEVSPSTLAA